MYKTFTPIFMAVAFFTTQPVFAQCAGDRYKKFVFENVTLTSDIPYGSNVGWTGGATENLFLDVYQPTGDAETDRPLVILVHGGSFIGGSKTGTDVVPFCNDFAKMGYVTASVQYRLGLNTLPPDSVSAVEAVVRSYHDVKAAIRFFRKDVAEHGNTYGIDPGSVFIIGTSAGGISAVHLAYLDELNELPPYVDYSEPGLDGGLEGNTGNAGYPDTVSAIVSICGALKDTAWMKPGDTPILSLHAVNDNVVPYGFDFVRPFFGLPILEVNGGSSIHEKADASGLINCFHTYRNVTPGEEHTPHVTAPAQYDTTLVLARNFLAHFVCGELLDCHYSNPLISNVKDAIEKVPVFSIYPNPVANAINIDLTRWGRGVRVNVFDAMGRLLIWEVVPEAQIVALQREGLGPGIYLVQLSLDGITVSEKIILR